MKNINNKLISLVFSFRNEEANLSELINRLEKTLNNLNYEYELIFVNDASNDTSILILEENMKRNNRIKVINMSRRFGISACILAGFKNSSGNAIVYMDSDLQDPPELIPKLIKKWEEGNDVVHTIRTKRRVENFFRMF